MIPDFKNFLNERYGNYSGSSYYKFKADTDVLIDENLLDYAKNRLNIRDEKEQWNWVFEIMSEFEENYKKETGEDFDFAKDRYIKCFFEFYYKSATYDNPPESDVTVSDVEFDDFNDIVEGIQKYVTSDPKVGEYVKEFIKDWATEMCEDRLNNLGYLELDDICN